MAAFLSKPPAPISGGRHTLLAGAQFWAPFCSTQLPPRDALGGVAGTLMNLGSQASPPTMVSGPFGPAIQFGPSSQQVQWPGQGYFSTLPSQITLHGVFRGDSFSNSPRLFATGSGNGSLAPVVLSASGLGLLFPASGNNTPSGLGTLAVGHWYGFVIAGDLVAARANFWLNNYTTGTLQVAPGMAMNLGPTTGGEGTVSLNSDSGHPFQGAFGSFGFSSALWSDQQAREYLRDPAAPFRRRRLPMLLGAAVAPAPPPPLPWSVGDDGPCCGFIEA